MAKLPYTFTICEEQEAPKQYTAMTPWMVKALRHGNDLTIDQRASVYPVHSDDFEGKLQRLLATVREQNNGQ